MAIFMLAHSIEDYITCTAAQVTGASANSLRQFRMSSEIYKYDDHFKTAREYLEHFHSDMLGEDVDEGLAMAWTLGQLHQTFTGDRDFGRRLLDVGSGPTVYQLISASRVCPEIICSDIHKGALAEIKKWKNGDPNAFDWTDAVKFVCELEGTRWESRQKQLQNAIKDTVVCDVFKENPLHPTVFSLFDTVITAYCLEGACWDKGRSTYADTVRNICSLLKPGGYFILMSYIGVTYYIEGGQKLPESLRLDPEFVLKSLSEAGITVLETSVYKTPEREECVFSDVKSILYVVGKKTQ
ncbi:PREDICTED: nicotinamide N-methyltransferase-like isoform X1 [Branchiostoma belcheri]|uniref:Nicotinamide N-methyltransferase-like isoform X1 n=2 Tax=Branchiostoma belcheri TaxID=7741 RepID=A0A6P4XZD0_BRABE|nr:PREDICTED: nicotinamide N-methyltransferase-like isoform X1 [Branchiostoma belcheri]